MNALLQFIGNTRQELMEQIRLNLDKTKKYVVACSFGPDSMALLDAALKENFNIVVAHVNYRKRDVSQFEQDSLTKYCNDHGIKIYVLDLKGVKSEGNFQEWAREKRYEFFKEVAKKEDAAAALVAHQEDDLIETYLMQKNRGNFVKNPGISREIEIKGVKILRPLLSYSKAFLLEYDKENDVPFSIDESNLKDDYSRNKIRHSVVEKMSQEEREKVLNEIKTAKTTQFVFKDKFTKDEFLSLSYEEILFNLDYLMQKTNSHRDISRKFVEEIIKAFSSNVNHEVPITDKILLELDYDEVVFVNSAKLKKYKFEFERFFKNDFIDLDFSEGAEDRGIEAKTEKLIIKNCDLNDKLIIKNYSSSINRLFIDWKMPHYLRKIWPGIYDEKGNLLYVPRYRKNFKDEHKSKFKINTEFFTTF